MEVDSPSEVSRILYAYILGVKRNPRTPSVEKIAAMMGVKAITIYKKLEGENPVTEQNLISIYTICRQLDGKGPVDALRYLVTTCDPRLYIGSIQEKGSVDGRLFEDIGRLASELGDVARAVGEAVRDNHVDPYEKDAIRKELDDLQAATDHLREELMR